MEGTAYSDGRSSAEVFPDLVQDRRFSSVDSKSLIALRHNASLYFRACSFIGSNILIFPFVSFQRQCQLNKNGMRSHLTPLSVLPVMFNYYGTMENIPMLFRGMNSYFLWRAAVTVSENVFGEVLNLPKEISGFNLNMGASHLMLKGLSFLVTSPLFVVHVIDSVQSGQRSASDLINLIKDTFQRIFVGRTFIRGHFIQQNLNSIRSDVESSVRLLRPMPYWTCIPLTTGLLLCSYALHSVLYYLVCRPFCNRQWKRYRSRNSGYRNADEYTDARINCWQQFYIDMCASLFADGLTACLLYPIDTIVCRLVVQGCRVIIDDTDHGVGVLPVATYYESINHCVQSVLRNEHITGFFKGFGCLLTQFAMQAAFAYFSENLLKQILDAIDSRNGQSLEQPRE